MSFQSFVTEKLQTIINRLNAIDNNSRNIDDLPSQTVLDLSSKIHVSRGGVSEKLDLQTLINQINSSSFNQIVSIGTITLAGNVVSIPLGAQWKINGFFYGTDTDTNITVPYASTDMNRIDILVANTLNQIVLIQGIESEDIAIRPNIPIDTILVTQLTVNDGGIVVDPPVIQGFYVYDYISSGSQDFNLPVGVKVISVVIDRAPQYRDEWSQVERVLTIIPTLEVGSKITVTGLI